MEVDAAELLKKGKTEIVDSVRKLQKDCYALPEADAAADFAATARLFRPLVGVLRDYDARFSAAKRERRLVDFSDLEHLTARLLPNGTRRAMSARPSAGNCRTRSTKSASTNIRT